MKTCFLSLFLLFTPLKALADSSNTEFPIALEIDGFRDVIARSGSVYISGQPTEEGLQWLSENAVTTVVNLRTQPEMDDREKVPFDEASKVAELGMKYVHIPLGGDDTPYTPEAVEAFASAVESSQGKVLLHCTVAWRASHMWAAYLVRYRGLSVDEAVRHGRAINLGTLPLEELLGSELRIELAEDD